MSALHSKPTATIRAFAIKNRLRVVTDKEDGTTIIQGKNGQVYEYDSDRLGVMYLSNSVGKANNRLKECEATGMEILQDGETEFAAVFLPGNPKQAALAIRVAGCKSKRVLSEARREQLRVGCESMTSAKSVSDYPVAGHLGA